MHQGHAVVDHEKSWTSPRDILRRHGIRPSRGYSQNFLVDRRAVSRIADACTEGNLPLVELGPGVGTLTAALLARGATVSTVEKDPTMHRILQEEFSSYGDQLRLTRGDATEVALEQFADGNHPIGVCGNLPYAVTGAVFRNVLASQATIGRAVFMVQKEVHDRLLAHPGSKSYGALTVFTRARFSVASVLTVGPGSFFPRPKVASAVVCLTPAENARPEDPWFRGAVRAAFEQRRKTLRNALGKSFGVEATEASLAKCQIDPKRRGETLGVDDYFRLADAFRSAGASPKER